MTTPTDDRYREAARTVLGKHAVNYMGRNYESPDVGRLVEAVAAAIRTEVEQAITTYCRALGIGIEDGWPPPNVEHVVWWVNRNREVAVADAVSDAKRLQVEVDTTYWRKKDVEAAVKAGDDEWRTSELPTSAGVEPGLADGSQKRGGTLDPCNFSGPALSREEFARRREALSPTPIVEDQRPTAHPGTPGSPSAREVEPGAEVSPAEAICRYFRTGLFKEDLEYVHSAIAAARRSGAEAALREAGYIQVPDCEPPVWAHYVGLEAVLNAQGGE